MAKVEINVGDDVAIVIEGVLVVHCITDSGKHVMRAVQCNKPSVWTQVGLLEMGLDYTKRCLARKWRDIPIDNDEENG